MVSTSRPRTFLGAALPLAVAAGMVAGMPAVSGAATLVVQPSSQDAYVTENTPNRIAGANPTNTRIRVLASPAGTQIRRGLVQFPLGAFPAGSTIASALVELYAGNNAMAPALTHGLYPITAAWLQSTVKWNNQPPTAGTPSATALVGDGRGFKRFDVTPDVQAAVDMCAADHGWMIKDLAETGSNDAVNYVALEEPHGGELENRPRLTVVYTPPSCVTDADCADTNLCTTHERCVSGVCAVDAVDCDDDNPCTDDICDCGSGCINASICNDGFSCTIDSCDPATLACTNTRVDAACATQCATGTCVADPDSTSVDPETGCVDTPRPGGTPCDDGDACTQGDPGDHCDGDGNCVAGAPRDCTPEDPCRERGGCDPASGACTTAPRAVDCGDPVCSEDPDCVEICDNCADDDHDGLVDRDDPRCARLADGAGQGTGDPKTRGAAVARCQKAIRTAALGFATGVRARLQRCADAVFACLQQKPDDAKCLPKARARCAAQIAVLGGGPRGLETRLQGRIAKACGPRKAGLAPRVARADLCGPHGLGFASEVDACGDTGLDPDQVLLAVSHAVAREHRCRSAELFTTAVPRGAELLDLGGVGVGGMLCLDAGAHGGHLGLGSPKTTGKAATACQRGIGAAGARFVAQVVRGEQRCADAMLQCVERKPGDARCRAKAEKLCRKTAAKLFTDARSQRARLALGIERSCGVRKPGEPPRLAFADLRDVLGLGYEALDGECRALGVGPLTSLELAGDCLLRQHLCRVRQLLTSHMPRARELLGLAGTPLP